MGVQFWLQKVLKLVPRGNQKNGPNFSTFAVLRGSKTGFKSLRWRLALAQRPFQTIVSFRINVFGRLKWPCKQPWEVHAIPPPSPPLPPRRRVLSHFCSGSAKKRWVFAHFRKRRFWHPLYLSFSLVFFLSVTGAETRPDSRGSRQSAYPPF